MRELRGVEVEREHLTRASSAVVSAVLLLLERARRGRAASRGVSPDPAPSRRMPLKAGEPLLPNAPPARAILVDLQHPRSCSSIISRCRVCRDDGRDASRPGNAGSCGVVSFGKLLARCTADAWLLLALPAQRRRESVPGFAGPCGPLPPRGSCARDLRGFPGTIW